MPFPYTFPIRILWPTPRVSVATGRNASAQSQVNNYGDALGIFQSDVIIRTGIIAALADLRANPYLIDYIFGSLPKDGLTGTGYGQKQVRIAKYWILNNEIKVMMDTRLDSFSQATPCYTISLQDSSETENTLGDVHYQAVGPLSDPIPVIENEITPSRSPETATMSFPDSIPGSLNLTTEMVVVDAVGDRYAITQVNDDGSIVLNPATIADFTDMRIESGQPSYVRHMESACFKETVLIGCHTHGDPSHLTFLRSLLVFIMLRYRQTLFEGRGLERTVISSSDFARDPRFGEENLYSRYVSVQGVVRSYWPKLIVPTIQSVTTQVAIDGAGNIPANLTTSSQSWVGDLDPSLPLPATTPVS